HPLSPRQAQLLPLPRRGPSHATCRECESTFHQTRSKPGLGAWSGHCAETSPWPVSRQPHHGIYVSVEAIMRKKAGELTSFLRALDETVGLYVWESWLSAAISHSLMSSECIYDS